MHDAVVAESSAEPSVGRRKRDHEPAGESEQKRREGCAEEGKTADDSSSAAEETEVRTNARPSEDSTEKDEEDERANRTLNEAGTAACPFCRKRFNNARRLRRHVVAIHERRTYECNDCRTYYYSEENLERHRKRHGDFFECETCRKRYKRKTALKHHQAREHSD